MNGGTHIVQEDLALYAMASLRGEDLTAVSAHLQSCAECREELKAVASDLTALGMSVDQQPVPEGARQHFMDSIRADVRPDSTARTVPAIISFAKRPAKTAWVPWAIAAALAVGAAGLSVKVNTLREQLREQSLLAVRSTEENVHSQRVLNLLMAPSAQRATLTATKTAVVPTGHAIYLADRGELIFQGSNLKSLPADKAYELWVIPANGSAPIPAGVFRPDKGGDASVVMPPLPPGIPAKAFAVTIERAEGSSMPMGPAVLSGAPTSGE
ncbi:anti-sigma factor domain-containing protein [Edaphobacter modestus]|uniref:Regulator of SigK n=1 Tax=Edaphobacter modestus TaxID=388466 RepID=A0A4Q7YYN1_9BACT|nr:anti-sigma factor [Edaphobacter modestus]RZU42371.1 anti-sigma-K factor RskA [Edaphobacter modestus]